MYCFRCGTSNRSTDSVCSYCGAGIITETEYENKKYRMEEKVTRKKATLIIVTTLLCCFIAVVCILTDGIVYGYGIIGLLVMGLVAVVYVSGEKQRIVDAAFEELDAFTYLTTVSDDKKDAGLTVDRREEKKVDIKEESVTEEPKRTSKIVSTMPVANSKKAEPKVKAAQNIYIFAGKNMVGYWKCNYCDTENSKAEASCSVCGEAN